MNRSSKGNPPSGTDRLAEIMAWKRQEVADRARPVRDHEWERCRDRRQGRGFAEVLQQEGLRVIAEIKRRSPSAGQIAPGRDAVEQARLYFNGGADAMSVLTDEKFFDGHIRDLWDVGDLFVNREDAPPRLRKDFFVHPIQILEAAEAGARAILIIVRALTEDEIRWLHDSAQAAGLDSLFEVHEEAEIERALRHKATLIGVNNRDLALFVTDLGISERLLPQIPDDCVRISESGIFDVEDARRAREAGADAVLVGEALMRADDPEALIAAFHECD